LKKVVEAVESRGSERKSQEEGQEKPSFDRKKTGVCRDKDAAGERKKEAEGRPDLNKFDRTTKKARIFISERS
jgi:hypothetical protein